MSTLTLTRIAYRAILRLHPCTFRAEFGDEMLWIFDEEARNGSSTRLLLDGLLSVAVQNIRPRLQATPQVAAAGLPFYVEIDSTVPAERIANTWLIALTCTLSLCLFLSMMVPGVAMPLGRLLYGEMQQLVSSSTAPQPHTGYATRR